MKSSFLLEGFCSTRPHWTAASNRRTKSQSRATIETLAEIKNPRQVSFVKQANIAGGNQQVNNGIPPSRAGENEIPPSKQSGYEHELLPDSRASALASRVDTTLEAVGVINRTTKRRG